MIKVDMIDAGVFQVFITDGNLDDVIAHCMRTSSSPDDLIRGTLLMMLGFLNESLESERSQDGLDRENEGMGRG